MFTPTISAKTYPNDTDINSNRQCASVRHPTQDELNDNAIRLARKIPLGKHTPEKCEAVHAWNKAVKDMLNGSH